MRRFYAFYVDAAKIAVQSIFAHKLRAFLTLIGIIIGVASVVCVGASISSLNSYVVDKISKILGANHFMIARMAHTGRMTEEEWQKMDRRNKRLDWDDLDWLLHQCSSCKDVGAAADSRQDLHYGDQDLYSTQITGVTANIADIEDKTIVEGRFILPHEVEHSAYVCVIGNDVREKLFQGLDPIGRTLKVNQLPMTIVGIEEKRGTMFGQTLDNNAYIPLTTFQQMFGRRQSLQLHGKAPNSEAFGATLEQAR